MKYSFTTPAFDKQLLHFAVGSDAHFGAGHSDITGKMLNLIAEPSSRYDLFFLLGDTVERGFADNQWHEAFQALSPTTSVIPTRFGIGNHDTLFTGLSHYEKYCYPQGMDIQTGSRLWYRIDVGKAHFLVIDLEWSAESYTSRQAKWLEEQLKSIPDNDWKIVMGHGFYYASGSFENGWQWYDNNETIKALTPLFEKYKVDLVFSGHAHQLELLQKAGVSYVICGGFGGPPDEGRTYKSPSSLWYASGEYGFVDVNLTPKEARIIFRAPDNSELETATISKLEK
jgi:UDP-2,3-diacylglucosamine pyrophosphatase LpxH